MRTTLIFIASVVAITLSGCATSGTSRQFAASDRTAITGVLDAQVAAWNRGDLVAYMDGYAKSDALIFTSGGKVRRGWQATFDAFQKRYAQDPKAMGKLAFTIQSVDAVGPDGAVVLGEWVLTGSPSDGRGIFSVVLERRPEGWRVVHDHTSSAAADTAAGSATAAATDDPKWRVPPGWRSEVIKFPLDFAKDIAHEGFEDIRFPPKFFEPGTGDYFSYAFIWRTKDAAQLDETALAKELTQYFKGLVAAVDEKGQIPATARSTIAATAKAVGNKFELTAHIFDAFKTKQPLDLTGWAERRACREGALWIFVLAPASTKIRAELDELAKSADCAR